MFQEEIEQQVGCKRISNLRAAKHRFESLATLVGRTLLYLASFAACCQRVAETRADFDNVEGGFPRGPHGREACAPGFVGWRVWWSVDARKSGRHWGVWHVNYPTVIASLRQQDWVLESRNYGILATASCSSFFSKPLWRKILNRCVFIPCWFFAFVIVQHVFAFAIYASLFQFLLTQRNWNSVISQKYNYYS